MMVNDESRPRWTLIKKGRFSIKGNKNNVKVSFHKFFYRDEVKYGIAISIGKSIAEELGVKVRNFLRIYVDSENPRILLINKVTDENEGYKVSEGSGNYLSIKAVWKAFKPKPEEIRVKEVTHEMTPDGLKVYL